MKSEVLSQFPGLGWSLVALVIFVLTFLSLFVLIYWKSDRAKERALSALPFSDTSSEILSNGTNFSTSPSTSPSNSEA